MEQEQDESLIWNPQVNGYVNKKRYLEACETRDPTVIGYKGISPNFGGGNVSEWETIGSTPKKMKKLTTVLSKNQKKHSFNVPAVTKKFEQKSNLEKEIGR